MIQTKRNYNKSKNKLTKKQRGQKSNKLSLNKRCKVNNKFSSKIKKGGVLPNNNLNNSESYLYYDILSDYNKSKTDLSYANNIFKQYKIYQSVFNMLFFSDSERFKPINLHTNSKINSALETPILIRRQYYALLAFIITILELNNKITVNLIDRSNNEIVKGTQGTQLNLLDIKGIYITIKYPKLLAVKNIITNPDDNTISYFPETNTSTIKLTSVKRTVIYRDNIFKFTSNNDIMNVNYATKMNIDRNYSDTEHATGNELEISTPASNPHKVIKNDYEYLLKNELYELTMILYVYLLNGGRLTTELTRDYLPEDNTDIKNMTTIYNNLINNDSINDLIFDAIKIYFIKYFTDLHMSNNSNNNSNSNINIKTQIISKKIEKQIKKLYKPPFNDKLFKKYFELLIELYNIE